MRFSESWIHTCQCLFVNWLHEASLALLSHKFYILSMFYYKWEYHSSMSDRIYADSQTIHHLDLSCQVEYSTWKVTNQVEIFLKKCWVELRSWTQELRLSWKAWFNNLTWKLNSIQQDIR